MNANRQQSSNGVIEKGRTSDILNYSHASDKIGDIEESQIRDDTVKLSRSKRKLKIKINKGKKGSRKPRLLDKLNTKKNREKLRDGLEELLDDDDYESFQTEMPLEQLNLELINPFATGAFYEMFIILLPVLKNRSLCLFKSGKCSN